MVGSSQVFNWEHNIREFITRESGPDGTLISKYWAYRSLFLVPHSRGPICAFLVGGYEYDGM